MTEIEVSRVDKFEYNFCCYGTWVEGIWLLAVNDQNNDIDSLRFYGSCITDQGMFH